MDFLFELVILPVADVDRAKAFYTEQMGFSLDVDHTGGRKLPGRAGDSARLGVFGRPSASGSRRRPQDR